MARPPLRFGVAHDFRTGPGSGVSVTDAYAAGPERFAAEVISQLHP